MIFPVILCGGSGSRLWPLSRKSFPKQFVPLIGNKSLLRLTLERLSGVGDSPGGDILCVAAERHRFLVLDAMEAAGAAGPVILEPVPRNTAAAMALAALYARHTGKGEALLLFCPADHHIPDVAAFHAMVGRGVAAAGKDTIVTFGIVPGFPSSAYGYIRRGSPRPDGSHRVREFIEKPDAARAESLLLGGDVLWNAGIFLVGANTLLDALERYTTDILENCRQAMAGMRTEAMGGDDRLFVRPEAAALETCRSRSIDYALMEKTPELVVVPFHGQWSDVGSWRAVADLTPPDGQGNRIEGQGTAHLAKNTYIHAPHRPVVALGTRDLLIVDTPDAVLVADSRHCEQVRDVLARLEDSDGR
uniref:Mannose-1-phosphate guanylyltransferase / mannose-6-phosphate isomerase n=1 Tax=Candidatus Kentrum sp. FM TaxID=2126340 RepID=A0A450SLA1_9GAMM|nr:MAG: mannose-1-phosphate guanylyltransferase / mannose-6-phosphate isomerase [Candidatus Kentron sp. FM]VFJ54374.1 MAG: mannose-1-phosphate guanylyltransferase / mannose-6-phosphate isomerase [Candidatus Kentron sp. FM]VFK10040.1 MAG: mannose-1-phosphate guanylyltransferase / mannose-6-phosphate isomerase [Candidatus Kentron sp. FM]